MFNQDGTQQDSAQALRVVFMGTPDFSVGILDAVAAAGHSVVAVYSQPPRKSGRGMKETPTPVHARAVELGIPVYTPHRLKSEDDQHQFETLCREHDVDVAVVVAYGLILPQRVLDAPRLGCVNVHASLLPRWRGAAPIQRAIEAGDSQTGVTFMQMDAGLDTGDMLRVTSCPISIDDTGSDLHDRLAQLGAAGIAAVIQDLASQRLTATPQPEDGITYAHKLQKAEGEIDWSRSAQDIYRLQRALTPWPGAFTHVKLGEKTVRLKVLELAPQTNSQQTAEDAKVPFGAVVDDDLTVMCGDGRTAQITRLQKPGKGPMDRADFLRGNPIPNGTVLF